VTGRDPRRFDHTCARCGRYGPAPTRWPDGHVCWRCLQEALRTRSRCPSCGYLRALPGRNPDGEAICTDCAGITRDFHCARCRKEGYLWAGRICTRCVLHGQLTALLDDGTGRTRPELLPLLESLLAMPQPDRGLMWLRNNPHLPGYLRGLARGDIPLSHAALHQLPSWRTAAHLRDLLMDCGALPKADRQILLFEQWQLRQLAAITDPGHQRLRRQYTTWHQLPKLHQATRTGPLHANTRNHAAEQFTYAARFLTWLAARHRPLTSATQADIDDWHATHPRHHGKLRGFLTWAITTGHAPPLQIPATPQTTGQPITRANMNTAANPTARWLFPGGRPGQPLTSGALLPSLRRLGIPAAKARTAALRELVRQAPAPVIAQALGYSHTTTHKHLAEAGGIWNRYATRTGPVTEPDHANGREPQPDDSSQDARLFR
jgi:hypothetical protein